MNSIPIIPFFKTSRYRVDTMLELADPEPGERGVDLGSGDGRILIAFAKAGVRMHGYEIDKKLRLLSEKNIQEQEMTNILMHDINFWLADLSPYNIITCYPMPDIMESLEERLQRELKPGARILLNYYPFPNWNEMKKKDNIYLYKK